MFNKTIIHNHYHFHIGEKAMSTLQETLDKIATIALGNPAEVQAEVDAVKATLAANAEADDAVKLTVEEHTTIINALVDKLAAAPAPVEPVKDETVVS